MEAEAVTTSRTDADAVTIPSARELARLKISAEVAWYLLSRGYELPARPPMIATPDGSHAEGAVFDPAAVDKVIAAFRVLRHTQGEWRGRPLEPDAWQVAYILAPVFGWVRWVNEIGRYVRVVRTLYVDVPRKNGKSTVCGGLAVYLTGADDEGGAQVVAAATTLRQAGFVFTPIKQLVESSAALKGRFIPRTGKILHPKSDSYFEVVSSAADAQHGANLHGAIIDELHVHKTPDLVETLETGTGSRRQPLVVMITTADDGKPETIYARKRKYVEQLARGVFEDPSYYGVVFGVPRDADPFAPETWAAANPGYPISPTHDYLASAAAKAKNSPAELASFLRLHLGIRTKQTTAFIGLPAWDRNAGARMRDAHLLGRPAYGGLDLGSTSDLTALCWAFPQTGRAGYDVIWRIWAPEATLPDLDKRTAGAATTWVKDGWLRLTPGEVTDYDFIRSTVLDDMETFDVQTVGLDMWNATHLANQLADDGVPLIEVRQGYRTVSPALKEIHRLITLGKKGDERLRNGGNPVLRWMVDNLAVEMDPAGNVKPSKKSSADKIDGIAALVNAVSEAMNNERPWADDDDIADLI
jgi:phage terminase large subunit-like protein